MGRCDDDVFLGGGPLPRGVPSGDFKNDQRQPAHKGLTDKCVMNGILHCQILI